MKYLGKSYEVNGVTLRCVEFSPKEIKELDTKQKVKELLQVSK
jgi:hypothetical protein